MPTNDDLEKLFSEAATAVTQARNLAARAAARQQQREQAEARKRQLEVARALPHATLVFDWISGPEGARLRTLAADAKLRGVPIFDEERTIELATDGPRAALRYWVNRSMGGGWEVLRSAKEMAEHLPAQFIERLASDLTTGGVYDTLRNWLRDHKRIRRGALDR